MSSKYDLYGVNFTITQYRKMFKRLNMVYLLIILLLIFLFYKVFTRPDLVYFAANESGVLKKVTSYTQEQAEAYQRK
ncbi:MAG: hypothetical protein KBD64_00195 [Gammaproteobacteria bacterium]|nr:hypothetical protein [Gammaproteobacteria bacterium]